jgi:aryl-alcohol dehydrogenase-like predicted oxidoreductase
MNLQRLVNSDLYITPIGIGAWAMGGGNWEGGWGPQNDSDSIHAIYEGLEAGLNWIDTAAAYGLGHSETIAGRALKNMRDRPYVFTKCSLVWDESGQISHNLQAASIRRELEGSLKRLNVEQIDLYQIHWPAWHGGPESASPGSIEEAVRTLAEMQRRGKIRHIGISNFDAGQMKRALSVGPSCFAAAALFTTGKRCRELYPSVRPRQSHGRDCLFSDVFRTAERHYDKRADCSAARGRLAQAQPQLPGTAPVS